MKKGLILIFVIGIIGAFLVNTSTDALALMTAPQKATLETLRSFTSNSSKTDISNEFGEPVKAAIGEVTVSWELVQLDQTTRIKAYFLTGKLNKIQFLSLEPFWGYTLYYSKEGVSNET
ncbi:hypothetical protein [Pseudoalteromonas sp.]|uniref:hypothetical protein n=1 Tax=Pseudoalteromonas sp. TaxID=53249 RepID=UPI0030018DBC